MPARKTHETFVREIQAVFGNEYKVIGTYVNSNTKIKMLHNDNDCMHEYEARPNDVINKGSRCPKCYGTHKKTTDQFKKEVYSLVGDEYFILSEYKRATAKLKMKHNIVGCMHEYLVRPSCFLSGSRCPKCFLPVKKTTTQFKEEVAQSVGNEYEVLGQYQNAHTKLQMKHVKCGHVYETTPNRFVLKGNRCPECAEKRSRGEERIKLWLEKESYIFEKQYILPGCRYKQDLRFDFAVFDQNKILMLIEFDGLQHQRPVAFWGGEQGFEETKKRDQIKNDYCSKKNIPLLRIAYSDLYRIDKRLHDEFDRILTSKRRICLSS